MKKIIDPEALSCPICAVQKEKIIRHPRGIILFRRGSKVLGLRRIQRAKKF